jgi:hypothetical protein
MAERIGGNVTTPRSGRILLAAMLAGLIAGLVVGAFHFLATEPVIEQAIALESGVHAGDDEPVVTREVQRVGGVGGWLLYGLFVGLVFGAVYALVQPRFDHVGAGLNALLSALVAYWLVALLPFLKYPANPPGVGEPDTIAYRQALFVLFWVLSVGGLLLAGWVYRLTHRRWQGTRPLVVAACAYVAYVGLLFVVMPPNPDPVALPMDLVTTFRTLSLAGLTLFWVVLGSVLGLLLRGTRPALAQ